MGRRYIAGFPWVGHYDTWKLDRLQKLIEKNHGLVFLPGHNCASDYKDTAESFQTVTIHSQELHDAVAAVKIKKDVKLSQGVQFMCRALGIPIPFLPVSGKNEYHLFTLLVHQLSGFDEEKMAIEWCKYVDGVSIFPKLPVYLCEYHKHWLHNERIKDAVKNMKSEIELLEAINKRQTPPELSPTTEGDDLGSLSADNDMEKNGQWALAWQGPAFPSMLGRPMQRVMRPLGSSRVYVGTEAMGTTYSLLANVNCSKKRKNGVGGNDRVEKRRRRRCGRCVEFKGTNANTCPGSSGRSRCSYFHDNGYPLYNICFDCTKHESSTICLPIGNENI
jgi:hypothetical protein